MTEMQKTDYMVFAGRQYFLGDKCQVTPGQVKPRGVVVIRAGSELFNELGTNIFSCSDSRSVWKQRGSSTTPSSKKWERTVQPSPCSSRNWERSKTQSLVQNQVYTH